MLSTLQIHNSLLFHGDWVKQLGTEHPVEKCMYQAIGWWIRAADADAHFISFPLSTTETAWERLLSLQDSYIQTTGVKQDPDVVRLFTTEPLRPIEPSQQYGTLMRVFPPHEQVYGLEKSACALKLLDQCNPLLSELSDITQYDDISVPTAATSTGPRAELVKVLSIVCSLDLNERYCPPMVRSLYESDQTLDTMVNYYVYHYLLRLSVSDEKGVPIEVPVDKMSFLMAYEDEGSSALVIGLVNLSLRMILCELATVAAASQLDSVYLPVYETYCHAMATLSQPSMLTELDIFAAESELIQANQYILEGDTESVCALLRRWTFTAE